MSYAQFLGQNIPYINTNIISLSTDNFLTYSIAPTLTQNVDFSNNVPTTIRTIVLPQGVWTWSLNFLITDTSGNNIVNYFVNVGNNLPLPSDNGLEQIAQTSYKGYPNSPLVTDSLSGICYSDGVAPFNIIVDALTETGSDATWFCYDQAKINFGITPSIQVARLSFQ